MTPDPCREAFEKEFPNACRNEYYPSDGVLGQNEYANEHWQSRYIGFKAAWNARSEVDIEAGAEAIGSQLDGQLWDTPVPVSQQLVNAAQAVAKTWNLKGK